MARGQAPLTIWVILVSPFFILKSQLHLQNKDNICVSGFLSPQQSLSTMIYGRVVLKLEHTSKSPGGAVKFRVETPLPEFLTQ